MVNTMSPRFSLERRGTIVALFSKWLENKEKNNKIMMPRKIKNTFLKE